MKILFTSFDCEQVEQMMYIKYLLYMHIHGIPSTHMAHFVCSVKGYGSDGTYCMESVQAGLN
jgi:hypothetical protein